MSVAIDTRVSPALDPEVFKVEGYDEETAPFDGGVISAFNDAYQTLAKVHDARELWEKNPAVTPENRIRIVGQEADKQKQRVLNRLALAERDLRANIAHTEKQLMQPLTERAGLGSLNGEVRTYVRGLDRAAREKFMVRAIESSDGPTLEAVLGAQSFLSGFTQIDHDHFLRSYHERHQPQLVRRLDLMQRLLDRFERSIGLIHKEFDKAVGAKPDFVAHLERANARAMAALKIEPTP
jgi:hypothetical protein